MVTQGESMSPFFDKSGMIFLQSISRKHHHRILERKRKFFLRTPYRIAHLVAKSIRYQAFQILLREPASDLSFCRSYYIACPKGINAVIIDKAAESFGGSSKPLLHRRRIVEAKVAQYRFAGVIDVVFLGLKRIRQRASKRDSIVVNVHPPGTRNSQKCSLERVFVFVWNLDVKNIAVFARTNFCDKAKDISSNSSESTLSEPSSCFRPILQLVSGLLGTPYLE